MSIWQSALLCVYSTSSPIRPNYQANLHKSNVSANLHNKVSKSTSTPEALLDITDKSAVHVARFLEMDDRKEIKGKTSGAWLAVYLDRFGR